MIGWFLSKLFGCWHKWESEFNTYGDHTRSGIVTGKYTISYMKCKKCGQMKIVKSET